MMLDADQKLSKLQSPPGEVKRALICGISGQDGSYLAQFLLGKGYEVHGTARDAQMTKFDNLQRLGIKERITFEDPTPK